MILGISGELSLVESIVDGVNVQVFRIADPENPIQEDPDQLQKQCDLYDMKLS